MQLITQTITTSVINLLQSYMRVLQLGISLVKVSGT